jgi:hypothetical protein
MCDLKGENAPPATMAHCGSSMFVSSMATIQYGPAKATKGNMVRGLVGRSGSVSCKGRRLASEQSK